MDIDCVLWITYKGTSGISYISTFVRAEQEGDIKPSPHIQTYTNVGQCPADLDT